MLRPSMPSVSAQQQQSLVTRGLRKRGGERDVLRDQKRNFSQNSSPARARSSRASSLSGPEIRTHTKADHANRRIRPVAGRSGDRKRESLRPAARASASAARYPLRTAPSMVAGQPVAVQSAAGKNSRTSPRARSTISARDLSISVFEELTTSSM